MGTANGAGLLVSDFRRPSGSRSACNVSRHALSRRQRSSNGRQIESRKRSKEFLRRLLGRSPQLAVARKNGLCGNHRGMERGGVCVRLRCKWSNDSVGGGHDDYFGSDVHAFDLATRCWSRIFDGYVAGRASEYGAGAVYPNAVIPTARRYRRIHTATFNMTL